MDKDSTAVLLPRTTIVLTSLVRPVFESYRGEMRTLQQVLRRVGRYPQIVA